MKRRGRARAPAAGTICNALATGIGSAFAIDRYTEATVILADRPIDSDIAGESTENRPESSGLTVTGEIAAAPDADTRLIERCVSLVVDAFADGDDGSDRERGEIAFGRVRTESDVAMAAGLKSSSAAANAAVLATLDALGVPIDEEGERGGESTTPVARVEACRLGVRAARETGVAVTGAFDDASASMLGGVTITDNTEDELVVHDTGFERDVLVWTPAEKAYSADADVERCRRIAPVAELVAASARAGDYERAMTANGFAYCGALGYSPEPMVEALAHVRGVSLSGTGPSVVAVGETERLEAVREKWSDREGRTWLTTTQTTGARVV